LPWFPRFGKSTWGEIQKTGFIRLALFSKVHYSTNGPSKNHPCDSQEVVFLSFPNLGKSAGNVKKRTIMKQLIPDL